MTDKTVDIGCTIRKKNIQCLKEIHLSNAWLYAQLLDARKKEIDLAKNYHACTVN
jgi:hypothetical protein